MTLLPADYALCALAITLAILGLFRGLSGTLGFLAGIFVSGATAVFCWRYSVEYCPEVWMRALATLVATLISFGLVRLIIKKLVNHLLSQPSDSFFGFLAGIVASALLLVVWAYVGLYLEYSNFATLVAKWL